MYQIHSLCNPGSHYPSFTCGVLPPHHDSSNREFDYSCTSTSPKSIDLTFEIFLGEDGNRTPSCRQVNGLAPLSSPKQGHLFGNIFGKHLPSDCVTSQPGTPVCSALTLCRSSAFITNNLINLWPLASTNYTSHESVCVTVLTECDQI